MATIKCRQCNLVNFNTQITCKRCGNPLNETAPLPNGYGSTPSAMSYQPQFQRPQSSFQTAASPNWPNQNTNFGYAQFQQPPPPAYYSGQQNYSAPSCMKCGTTGNTSIRTVKKEKVPLAGYLALLLGLLPGLIILLLLKKTHRLNIPFCEECYGRFKFVSFVDTLTGLFLLFGSIIALIAAAVNESFIVFFICGSIVGTISYFGYRFCRRNDLKFVKLTRSEVVVRDPLHGDVTLV